MSLLDGLTKSLLSIYTEKLNAQQKQDFIDALDVVAYDLKYNQFNNIFPETGKLSRFAYPKHMELFAAGAKYIERAAVSGNRCITPWTYISIPTGERPAHVVFSEEGADVLSWDGENQCTGKVSGGFLKCIEPAYRLVMEGGAFFDCTKEHRVLAESGWMSLCQLMSLSSGLRYWQTLEDYQANCVEDGYLYDLSLLTEEEISQKELPIGAYAQKQLLTFSHMGAKERILQCNRAYQSYDLLSSPDDRNRFSALYGQFLAAYVPQPFLHMTGNNLAVLLSQLALDRKLALQTTLSQCKCKLDLYVALREVLDDLNKSELLSDLVAYDWQSDCKSVRVTSSQELLRDDNYIGIFYPFQHPSLVGNKKIIAIVPLGFQPIIDVTIPEYKNYFAAGVVQKNYYGSI
jgi:hypothetical protein